MFNVCQMFQSSNPLETPKELSVCRFYGNPSADDEGGLIVNSLPLNHSAKLSSRWDAGKTEREDKSQKTEQGEGCALSCICSMTSLAMPVRVECGCLIIPSAGRIIFQIRRDLMCFSVCWLLIRTDLPHKIPYVT